MLSCARVGSTPNRLSRPPGRDAAPGMLSLGPGCLAILAVCGAVGYGVFLQLPQTSDKSPVMPAIFAAIIGLLGGLVLSSVWSMARGFGRGANSRRALDERARTDGAPQDDGPIIATGVVRSDRPLTSPIGGVPCAAYEFRMYTAKRGSKGREEVPVYWGFAGLPFNVDSRGRRYPVASVPLFAWEAAPLADDASKARARAYLRSTGWETVELGMLGTIDTALQRASGDATTGARRDFALAYDEAPDVALLTLEEAVLPIGETVSVFGTWSGALGAIVAPPAPTPITAAVVAKGGPENLDGQPGVPHATTSYVTTTIVMTLLAGGLFWIATVILPTMR